jgi:uncharacterized delta-60 repeat protein
MHKILCSFLCLLGFSGVCQTVDPGFTIPFFSGISTIQAVQRLANDKLLIAGDFMSIGTTPRTGGVVLLNPDGTIDNTFTVGSGFQGGAVYAIAVQPDGKIILAGIFSKYNGLDANDIVRLNTDGSIDASFNPGTGAGSTGISPSVIFSVAIQDDGKILASGLFSSFNGVTRASLVRLNADGSVDQTYTTAVTFSSIGSSVAPSLLLQQDGKLLLAGDITKINGISTSKLVRLNADGSLDAAFSSAMGTGFSAYVGKTALQSDGKIVVIGSFSTVNGLSYNRMARLNTDGSVDNTFNADAGFNNGNGISSLLVLPDNSIIVTGNFQAPTKRIARLTANGVYDNTFNVGTGVDNFLTLGFPDVGCVTRQSDGKIIIGGTFTRYNGVTCISLARVNTNGSLDTGYKPNPANRATITGILPAADGKVYIAGNFIFVNGAESKLGVVRLNADGTNDPGFNISGISDIIGSAVSLSFDSNGKLLISGEIRYLATNYYYGLGRFNTDGSFDNTWTGFTGLTTSSTTDGSNGTFVQSDGKIILGGSFSKVNGQTLKHFARLNSNGTLDNTFNPTNDFTDEIRNFDVRLSDGKVIMAQDQFGGSSSGTNRISLANANGSRDNNFNVTSKFNGNSIFKAIFTSTGKILVGGDFTQFDGQPANKLLKLNDAGSRDVTFSVSDPMTGYSVTELVQLNSGLILIGKSVNFSGTPTPVNYLDVIDENGTSVSEDLRVDGEIQKIAATATHIYIGGKISSVSNTPVYSLVRLTNPTAPATAPSNLTTATYIEPRRNVLTWTDNTTTEGVFEVHRSVTTNGNFLKIGIVSADVTTYTDDNSMSPATQYFYKVKAVNINGASAFSNESGITTLPDPPPTPAALFVSDMTETEIELKWTDNASNETGFEIYRSTPTNSAFTQVGTSSANVATYRDTGLTIGITYYYKIRAVNSGGVSGFSNEVNQIITGLMGGEEKIVSAYPNPTSGNAVLENFTSHGAGIACFNSVGAKVLADRVLDPNSTLNLDIADWPSGIYSVSVHFPNRVRIIKLIKL